MIYRSNHNGIVSEFTIPLKEQKGIIVLLSGIPSVPKLNELLEAVATNGYVAIFPRYRGTWESIGNFLEQSPVTDIEELCTRILKDKKITELYALKEFSITTDNLIIVGTSFGGSVALCTGELPFVKKVIALSPVVDWTNYAGDRTKHEFEHMQKFYSQAFGGGYRFSEQGWRKFESGELFNPPQKIEQKFASKIMIVSDPADKTTSIDRIDEYAQKNAITLKKTIGIGHVSFSKLSIKNLFSLGEL